MGALAGACGFVALPNADFSAARPLSTVPGSALGLVVYTCAATSASSMFARSCCGTVGLSTAWKYTAWYSAEATALAGAVTSPSAVLTTRGADAG